MNTPDTEELDEDHNQADADALKVLNTPDTEWESVELAATNLWAIIYEGLMKDGVKFPNNFNGIGAAYGGYARIIEAFGKERSSRDTYWKERVRKEKNEVICFLDELLREMFSNLPDNSDERLGAITALTHIRNEIDAYCLTPTPITNEDNLK